MVLEFEYIYIYIYIYIYKCGVFVNQNLVNHICYSKVHGN